MIKVSLFIISFFIISCGSPQNEDLDGDIIPGDPSIDKEIYDEIFDYAKLEFDSYEDSFMEEEPELDNEDEPVIDIIDAFDSTPDEEEIGEPPLEPLFSFAILTDTHVTGNDSNADRLRACVEWINTHAFDRMIELVLVLGDIGWGSGLEISHQILEELTVPYVPIIGDNEVVSNAEEAFSTTFSEQYDFLSTLLSGWQKSPAPVWNPEAGQQSWFTNLYFEHHGVHFIGLDWAVRGQGEPFSEFGDLHNFEGGTWQWFEEIFLSTPKDASESIVMFSHIPMHLGAFTWGEMDSIESLSGPYASAVYADFAGHVHITYERPVPEGGYIVYVTDATWDDENVIRLVTVNGNGVRFEYIHEIITI